MPSNHGPKDEHKLSHFFFSKLSFGISAAAEPYRLAISDGRSLSPGWQFNFRPHSIITSIDRGLGSCWQVRAPRNGTLVPSCRIDRQSSTAEPLEPGSSGSCRLHRALQIAVMMTVSLIGCLQRGEQAMRAKFRCL